MQVNLPISRELLETIFISCFAIGIHFVSKSHSSEIPGLRRSADTDGLTQLSNITAFRRAANPLMQRARQDDSPIALLMIDIDDFKHFNDVYGHESGNEALKGVAAVLRDAVRSHDLLARCGGEEFIALVNSDHDGALAISERMRERTAVLCSPEHDKSIRMEVQVSIGVAFDGPQIKTLDDLIAAADEQLYHAKRTGKNRVSFADNVLV